MAGPVRRRLARPSGTVEVRLDAPEGVLAGSGTLYAFAGTNTWANQSAAVNAAADRHKLVLVFRGIDGGPATGLADLNRVEFASASP